LLQGGAGKNKTFHGYGGSNFNHACLQSTNRAENYRNTEIDEALLRAAVPLLPFVSGTMLANGNSSPKKRLVDFSIVHHPDCTV
jgi:hypothetical protein